MVKKGLSEGLIRHLFVFELRRDVYMDLALEMQCLASLSLQEKAIQKLSSIRNLYCYYVPPSL